MWLVARQIIPWKWLIKDSGCWWLCKLGEKENIEKGRWVKRIHSSSVSRYWRGVTKETRMSQLFKEKHQQSLFSHFVSSKASPQRAKLDKPDNLPSDSRTPKNTLNNFSCTWGWHHFANYLPGIRIRDTGTVWFQGIPCVIQTLEKADIYSPKNALSKNILILRLDKPHSLLSYIHIPTNHKISCAKI